MKLLKIFVLLFVMLAESVVKAQTNDLTEFLKKFEAFKESSTATLRWTKSPDASDQASFSVPMPNPVDVSKTYVEEPKTGLWHYPHLGKVYDPETSYYIDFDAHRYFLYRIDVAKGKVYKGENEIAVHKKKDSSSN